MPSSHLSNRKLNKERYSRYSINNENSKTFIRNNNKTLTWDIDPGDNIYLGIPLYLSDWSIESIFTTCLECNSKTAGSSTFTNNYPDVCASIKNITSTSLDIYIINHQDVIDFQITLSGINITGITPGNIISDWGSVEFNNNTISATIEGFDGSGINLPPGNWNIITVHFNQMDSEVCFDQMTFTDESLISLYSIGTGDCYNSNENRDRSADHGEFAILGEGLAGMYTYYNEWIGSLTTLENTDGYILISGNLYCTLSVNGELVDDLEYSLNGRTSLLSFNGPEHTSLTQAVSDFSPGFIQGVISQKGSTNNPYDIAAAVWDENRQMYRGSLRWLYPDTSYWIILSEDTGWGNTPFHWNTTSDRGNGDDWEYFEFDIPDNPPPPTLTIDELIYSLEDQINGNPQNRCWYSGGLGDNWWEWRIGPLNCTNGAPVCDYSECSSYTGNCCNGPTNCPGHMNSIECCNTYGGGARPCGGMSSPSEVDAEDYTQRIGEEGYGKKPGEIWGID